MALMIDDAPRAMPALVTPFGEDGDIDLDAHRRNIERLRDRGCRGVLIAGSTGEGPLLDPGERHALVEAAKDSVPGLTVICGINAESTRQASRQIEEAKAGGADAALVITPTTVSRGRTPFVEQFFIELAATSGIPILLYTVPGVTGWNLPVESVNRLSARAGIAGVKDSSGLAERIGEITDGMAGGFIVYAGASRALLESHRLGAYGAITASGNYALHDVSLAVSGDATSQQRLVTMTSAIEPHGVPGTKLAAKLCGLESGGLRSPLMEVGPNAAGEIVEALQRGGLL